MDSRCAQRGMRSQVAQWQQRAGRLEAVWCTEREQQAAHNDAARAREAGAHSSAHTRSRALACCAPPGELSSKRASSFLQAAQTRRM